MSCVHFFLFCFSLRYTHKCRWFKDNAVFAISFEGLRAAFTKLPAYQILSSLTENNRPQVYALLRSVLTESHWNSAPRALHALSLHSQLLSEANGSTFHFGPRSPSPTGTQHRSAHSETKNSSYCKQVCIVWFFCFADVLNQCHLVRLIGSSQFEPLTKIF